MIIKSPIIKSESIPIKILYLSLHNQLKHKYGVNRIISRKEFYCKLGKHSQVPKIARVLVIKEMEDMNLIKQENRESILILPCEWDLERDATKFYEWLGIY